MIHHVIVVTKRADASPADEVEVVDRLRAVAASIDGVIRYRLGADLGLRPTNADFAIVGTFRDRAALTAYLTAPDHLAVLKELGPRFIAESRSVQFEDE